MNTQIKDESDRDGKESLDKKDSKLMNKIQNDAINAPSVGDVIEGIVIDIEKNSNFTNT